jgi:regulatory protein
LGLLARREHGASELKRKLGARGDFAKADIDQAVESLRETGAQSDQRYALAIARSRARKGYGPRFVAQELASKGIARALIQATLKDPDIDWDAARQKALGKPVDSPSKEASAKLKSRLARRGF